MSRDQKHLPMEDKGKFFLLCFWGFDIMTVITESSYWVMKWSSPQIALLCSQKMKAMMSP